MSYVCKGKICEKKAFVWRDVSPKGCVISTGAGGGTERSVKNRFLDYALRAALGMTEGGLGENLPTILKWIVS